MTDRLDDLLFSIGEEQNDRVDFDQMYADLLQKQKEEEKKRSTRRSRFVRYGAMAACAVALVGIGAAMINSSRPAPEAAIHAPMSDGYTAAAAAEEAPAEAAPAEEPMMAAAPEMKADETAEAAEAAEAGDTAGGSWDGATLAMQNDDPGDIEIEIGLCPDAESRLKAAGIAAEPYEGGGAPQEGYALMMGEGEAIWNAGSGVYRVTLNGDIAEQLKELCE